jgi:ubiquinone/menaquinone biosynthesis C-methylase UbiE
MIYNKEQTKYDSNIIFDDVKPFLKKKNIKILNAGCGSNWIKKFIPKTYEITGLDKNNPNADIDADLGKKLPIKNEQYDLIICTSVIEHIQNPLFTLKEFNRILKKNGILYVTAPSPTDPSTWDDPYHYRPYTLNSLKVLGTDSNFKFLKGYYSNLTPFFGILKIDRFKRFYYFWKYKFRFINHFKILRGTTHIILKK